MAANQIRGRRRLVALATIVLGACVLTLQPGARGASVGGQARAGGIVRRQHRGALRLRRSGARGFPASWRLIDTTCARLMTYPDKPPPEAYRLVPGRRGASERLRDGRRGRSRSEAGFASATGRRCGRARSRVRSPAP